jgi:hypothetical protein
MMLWRTKKLEGRYLFVTPSPRMLAPQMIIEDKAVMMSMMRPMGKEMNKLG